MKKILFLAIIFIALLSSCSSDTNENTNSSNLDITINISQPERKMDIYGKVVSQEWNEITLLQVDTSKDPTFNMTSEEKKKYMQSLPEESRKTLKEEINSAILWQIKIIIPVWIAMTKKEAQWSDAPNIEGSLADIQVWWYISVWLNQSIADQKIAEFVKISFIQ